MAATRTIIQTWNGTDWVVSTPASTLVLPQAYALAFGTTDGVKITAGAANLEILEAVDTPWVTFSTGLISIGGTVADVDLSSTQLSLKTGLAASPSFVLGGSASTTGAYLAGGANFAISVSGANVATFTASGLQLATVLAGQYGGTGVANTGKTITVSGNTTIGSSTHTVAFATGANTAVTLPSSGTLATLAGTEALTNKTINGSNNTITNVSLTTGVTGTLPVANGGTAFTTAPKVIAYPSTNQTLTSGGTTDTVAFGTEVVDTDNAFASNTFTVPSNQGGYYLISLSSLYLQSGGSSSGINVSIAVNGSAVARIYQQPIDAGFAWGAGGASLLSLSAGDAVTIKITQADGTAWDILGGISTLGRLTIHRVI